MPISISMIDLFHGLMQITVFRIPLLQTGFNILIAGGYGDIYCLFYSENYWCRDRAEGRGQRTSTEIRKLFNEKIDGKK